MKKDLYNDIVPVVAINPQNESGNSELAGAIIDTQGFESLTFLVHAGSLADADATFIVDLEHGDDSALSDTAAVPDAQLLGTEALASPLFSEDNTVRKIGYIGVKRYVRLNITPASNTGNAFLCVSAFYGHPTNKPNAQA